MENIEANKVIGAIQLLTIIEKMGILLETESTKHENKLYTKAIYECLKDPNQMEKYLQGGTIAYHSHVWDEKTDKLKDVKAKVVL